jgi:hypothetical protein
VRYNRKALSEIRQSQMDFWTAFSRELKSSSFPSRTPAAKSWNYLSLGTSRARIVVAIDLTKRQVGCKLALLHSSDGLPRDRAELVYEGLHRDRSAIESELGFSDLIWGKPTGTRIYRYEDVPSINERRSWLAAIEWLISCAERFKQVFGPRIGQMEIPGAPGSAKAFAAVEGLGDWSGWVPIEKSLQLAPREPGVYMARTGRHGPVIYVGMAGERSGKGTKTPQGLRGRLSAYLTGQGLGGGLLGRSFDRALRDPAWLRQRIADLEAGNQARAKDWGIAALVPHHLYVRWMECIDKKHALELERNCLNLLKDAGLWNHQD